MRLVCFICIFLGADINVYTRDEGPCTPLHIAVQFGHLKVVALLLNNKVLINAIKPDDGNTALILSLKVARPDIAKLLIDSGADITVKNKGNITALMLASARGLDSIVRILLTRGENPDEECNLGCSALDFAITAGHAALADLLQRHIFTTTKNSETSVGAKIDSPIKQLSKAGINMYDEGWTDEELCRGHVFLPETKRTICDNPSCLDSKKEKAQSILKKCNRCRCVRYCTKECQVQHWPTHKRNCCAPTC